MTKLLNIILISSILLIGAGCGLWPKTVEFGQSKVKPVPEKTQKNDEQDRQAAQYVDKKVEQSYIAAIRENSSTNVMNPLFDAHIVAPALSLSLGPPMTEWPMTAPATNLVKDLHRNVATLNKNLETYREKTEPLVGKKIEGTGFFQIGYFSYVLILIVIGFILYEGIKIAINIAGNANPVIGLGTAIAGKISGATAGKALSEVVQAGEDFKDKIVKEITDPALQTKILSLFSSAHAEAQSADVKAVVKTITG